jgi:poly(A) polymerase
LPAYVKEALSKLDEAGHVAYVVGGSVRDFLLNKEPKDHDIATDATPDELSELFPNSIEVGKAFGVLKIPVKDSHLILEIATFRKDLDYKDHRHPEGVELSTPEEDAVRRDFTVNALFYDFKTSRILDCVNGIEDLQKKIIRSIGDPQERFREDALRLIRAIRFAIQLGFEIHPETLSAIKEKAKLISKISYERIRDEIHQMWIGPNPAGALNLLSKCGLLSLILPEVEDLKQIPKATARKSRTEAELDTWTHTLKIVDTIAKQNPSRSPALVWAGVLHETGKAKLYRLNKGRSFNGHEIEGAKIAKSVGDRFKLTKNESHQIVAIIENHLHFRDVFKMRESTLQRFVTQPYFETLLAFHKADATITDGNLANYEFCASKLKDLGSKGQSFKLIDGNDLIQLGLSPGKEFSEIIRKIEDLAMENLIKTKEEALEYVIKNFVK